MAEAARGTERLNTVSNGRIQRRSGKSTVRVARQQTKIGVGPTIACDGMPWQRLVVDGSGPIFTAGAYRDIVRAGAPR